MNRSDNPLEIKLPRILPPIMIVLILTFVDNFNAFDFIFAAQGALAGPDFSTNKLGTFVYHTFFGFQLQLGGPHRGSAIATAMFVIILIGVCQYFSAFKPSCAEIQLTSSPLLRPFNLYIDRAVSGFYHSDQRLQNPQGDFRRPAGPPPFLGLMMLETALFANRCGVTQRRGFDHRS